MTEDDLDGLMHHVLMDALRMEWSDTLNAAPSFVASRRFQAQVRTMLADPFAWYRKKTLVPSGKKRFET